VVENRPSILVVEDDGEMRSLLRDGLWNEGYSLREARDGDEAFQAVLRAVPDLIITEMGLSSGGIDYLNRLRVFVPHCPIIVMTAFGDEKLKVAVLRAGATAYFSKPVHLAELRSCVKQLLDAGRQTAMKTVVIPEGVR
jgi:DNA-binding response OmpR family regulator